MVTDSWQWLAGEVLEADFRTDCVVITVKLPGDVRVGAHIQVACLDNSVSSPTTVRWEDLCLNPDDPVSSETVIDS